jgi:hypothetical protein
MVGAAAYGEAACLAACRSRAIMARRMGVISNSAGIPNPSCNRRIIASVIAHLRLGRAAASPPESAGEEKSG